MSSKTKPLLVDQLHALLASIPELNEGKPLAAISRRAESLKKFNALYTRLAELDEKGSK